MNHGKVVFSCAVILLVTACGGKTAKMEGQRGGAAPAKSDKDEKAKTEENDAKALEAITLSVADREAIYADFKLALKANYTFQKTKKEKLDAHIDACAKEEAGAPANTWVNLRFEDRFRECISTLRDGHLQLRSRRPKIMTGVTLRELDGGFYVESIRKDAQFVAHYRNKFGIDIREVLKPGTQVVQINSGSINEILKGLIKKTSASTDTARRELAVSALTERNFQYSRFPTLRLTVVQDDLQKTIAMDWFHESSAKDPVALKYFRTVKIAAAPFLSKDADWSGYSAQSPLYDGIELTYRDENGRIILRQRDLEIATVGKDGAKSQLKACYLQLLSFKPSSLVAPDGMRLGFALALQQLLGSCENEGRALVLDLRANDGGRIENAEALMSLVTEKSKTYAPIFTTGLRTRNFVDLNLQEDGPRANSAYQAARENLEYLPLITNGNITAPKDGAGFNQKKVAVLVSSRCISVCDVFAGFIKNSKRGVLIGAGTAGAFGALASSGGQEPSVWVDQKFNTFAVEVPNSFMGVLPEVVKDGEPAIKFDITKHMLEGKAIEPDGSGRYNLVIDDLRSNGAGIRGTVDAFLKSE